MKERMWSLVLLGAALLTSVPCQAQWTDNHHLVSPTKGDGSWYANSVEAATDGSYVSVGMAYFWDIDEWKSDAIVTKYSPDGRIEWMNRPEFPGGSII